MCTCKRYWSMSKNNWVTVIFLLSRPFWQPYWKHPYDLVIKCNFCQHQWTPWPLKPRTRWKNFFPRPKIKWDIVIFLIWRPCWRPSWFSQIPQGWQSVTRWIIDLDPFESQNPTENNYAPNFAHPSDDSSLDYVLCNSKYLQYSPERLKASTYYS